MKILFTFLAALCCTVMAFAANRTKIDNIYYILDDINLTATVTWGGNDDYSGTPEYNGSITIPSTVTNDDKTYNVTSIGENAFDKCSGLTSITIPEGVTSIGQSAFFDCCGLTSVRLPESLESIGHTAFYSCYKIFGLEVPDGVTSIGKNAFAHIRNVIFNGNATDDNNNNWGASALNGHVEGDLVYDSPLKKKFCAVRCSFTSQLVIPEGVEEIGSRAIFHCSVSSVVIPSTVTKVEIAIIHEASNLKDIYVLPITPPTDGDGWVFVGLTLLEHIYVLNDVAYKNWTALSEDYKNKVTSCPLDVLIKLYKDLLTDKKNTSNLTDEEKTAVVGYITEIEKTTETLEALKIYTEAIIYILMKDVDNLIDYDINTINSHIATIRSATDMGTVATAQTAAIAIINTRLENNTAIDELKAFIDDNKIANAPLDEYVKRINAATSADEITSIVNNIKNEINESKKFTLGEWKYLLEDENGEYTIVGDKLTFTDKEAYQSNCDVTVGGRITYYRTFTNTNWQPLYVPFAISYDEWAEKFDVAAINNFHEYTDADGKTVKTELEVRLVKSGTLKPNHPYLIRAKDADVFGPQMINLSTKKIYPSEENSIVCSSVERKYTFTGTYQEMTGLKTKGYIFMSGGKLCKAEDDDITLSPQRWYLKIESLGSQVDDESGSTKAMQFDIKLLDDDVTGIDEITVTRTPLHSSSEAVYNLNGMRVNDNYKGIVIKKGKKIYQR